MIQVLEMAFGKTGYDDRLSLYGWQLLHTLWYTPDPLVQNRRLGLATVMSNVSVDKKENFLKYIIKCTLIHKASSNKEDRDKIKKDLLKIFNQLPTVDFEDNIGMEFISISNIYNDIDGVHAPISIQLMLRISEIQRKSKASPEELADTQIEHIFPKGAMEEVEWVDRLGNLTLLESSLNNQAKNKKLSEKQPYFRKSNIALNQELSYLPKEYYDENYANARENKIVEDIYEFIITPKCINLI